MSLVASKSSPIELLSVDTLIHTISQIEMICPGWWYTVSQQDDEIWVNVGPGRQCPREEDNKYALTKHGDQGSLLIFDKTGGIDDDDFRQTLNTFLLSFNSNRGLEPGVIHLVPRENVPFRFQSVDDLKALQANYEGLLRGITLLHQRGHHVGEVYLGSCDLSADCSLRGKRVDDSEFDVSFDLKDGTIAEALSWSFNELKNDALTPR
jgi:hypothetical protein